MRNQNPRPDFSRELTTGSLVMLVALLLLLPDAASARHWLAFGLALTTLLYLNLRYRARHPA